MLGVLGGSGFYQLAAITDKETMVVDTPFGPPSAPLVKGHLGSVPVVFLPRHGKDHEFLPGEINYRANIYALKKVGVRRIVGVSAVGSLKMEIAPGSLCLPDQYLDFTKGNREPSFFGEGVSVHVSTAHPTCQATMRQIQAVAEKQGTPIRVGATYACVEGPRLGTRAESFFLRTAGADLVGMTNVPEAFLAKEAQLCYATIAMATDYDCWLDDPEQHASASKIMELYRANLAKIESILLELMKSPISAEGCGCRQSLSSAIITHRLDSLPLEKQALLSFLRV